MWKQLLRGLASNNPYVTVNPPATLAEIHEVEEALKVVLPEELKKLLLELNGNNYFLLSTKQIIETNTMLRGLSAVMPLNCLLFIAGNGCGDYYGYAITGDGLKDWEIYMWDHEYDNRIYKARGLQDLIEKYYTDQL